MGFQLKKVAPQTEPKPEAANEQQEEQPATKSGGFGFKKPAQDKPAAAAKPAGFLKTGVQARAAMDKAEAEYAARKQTQGGTFRFWLKPGEDAHITFLDGAIDPETGILNIPYTNEHRVKIDGHFKEIVCIEDQEPCPLCAAGEKRAFVGYLSIIDHRGYETNKDGKKITVEYARRLLVPKSESLKQLTKLAEKRGGTLAGYTFEVSRTGEKKPAIGDMFDEVAKHELSDVLEHFGDDGKPLDYESEAVYLTADEMQKLGLGKTVATIGSGGFGGKKTSMSFGGKKADEVDDDKPVW